MDPENNIEKNMDKELINQMSQIRASVPKKVNLYNMANIQKSQVAIADVVKEINDSVLSMRNADLVLSDTNFKRKDNATKHLSSTIDDFIAFSQLQSETLQQNHNLKETIMIEHSYATNVNKFECNFGVSDTQLVDLIDGAEILLNVINEENECVPRSATKSPETIANKNLKSEIEVPKNIFSCNINNPALPSTSKENLDCGNAGSYKSICIDKNKQNSQPHNEEMFLTQLTNTQNNGHEMDENVTCNDNLQSSLKKTVSLTEEIMKSKMALIFNDNPCINVCVTSQYSAMQDCIDQNVNISQIVEFTTSSNNKNVVLDDNAFNKPQTTLNDARKDNMCIDEDIMKDFEVDFIDRYKSNFEDFPVSNFKTQVSDDLIGISNENVSDVETIMKTTSIPLSEIIMINSNDIDSESEIVLEDVGSLDEGGSIIPHNDHKFHSYDSNNIYKVQIQSQSVSPEISTLKVKNILDADRNAENCDFTKLSSEVFHSFRTASNKDIIMSKQALDSAKSVFGNILNELISEEDICGIQEMEKTNYIEETSNVNINQVPLIKNREKFSSINNQSSDIKSLESIKSSNEMLLNLKEISSENSKVDHNDTQSLKSRIIKTSRSFIQNKHEGVENFERFDFYNSFMQESGNSEKALSYSLPSKSFNFDIADNGFKSAKDQGIKISTKSFPNMKSLFKDILEKSSFNDVELIQSPNIESKIISGNESSQNLNFSDNHKPSLAENHFLKGITVKGRYKSNCLRNTDVITLPKEMIRYDFDKLYNLKNSSDTIRDNVNAIPMLKLKRTIPSNEEIASTSYFPNSCNDIMECNTELMQICDEVDEVIARDSSKVVSVQSNQNELSDLAAETNKPLFQVGLNTTPSLLTLKTDSGEKIKVTDSSLKILRTTYTDNLCMDTGNSDFNGNEEIKNIGLLFKLPTCEMKGFKTGSGKDIKISAKSLATGEKIFKEILSDCDNKIIETDEHSHTGSSGTHSGHVFHEFVTGSGQKIQTSEKSLSTASKIFKDVAGFEDCSLNMTLKERDSKILQPDKMPLMPEPISLSQGFKSSPSNPMVILEPSLAPVEPMTISTPLEVSNCKHDLLGHEKKNTSDPQVKTNFEGFKTGLGREIKVSETALKCMKNIFNDFVLDDFIEPRNLINMQTNINKMPDQRQEATIPPKSPEFLGFKTGLGKVVQISDESLSSAKCIFKELISEDEYELQEHSKKGLSAGLDKEVHLSKKSIPFCNVLNDMLPEDSICPTKLEFPGFKTGSGKTVNVSEKSLLTVKNVFEDIFLNARFKGFKSGSGKDILVTEESLSLAKNIFKDLPGPDESDNTLKEKNKFVGFQTGSGKDISVSEKSLSIARNIFNDLPVDMNKSETGIKFTGFKTGLGKAVNISEQSLSSVKNIFNDIPFDTNHTSDNNFNFDLDRNSQSKRCLSPILTAQGKKAKLQNQGLHTASGSQVKISDESLSLVCNIFNDADPINEIPKTTLTSQTDIDEDDKISGFMGFQTGNNKSIAIAKDSLHAVKHIFGDKPFDSLVKRQRREQEIGDESLRNTPKVQKKLAEGHLHTAVEPVLSFVTPDKVLKQKSKITYNDKKSQTDDKENDILNESNSNVPRLNKLAFKQVKKNDQVQEFEDNLNAYFKRKILDDFNIQNPTCKRRCSENDDNYIRNKTPPRGVSKTDEFCDFNSENINDSLYPTSPILVCKSILKKSKKAFKTPFTIENVDTPKNCKLTQELKVKDSTILQKYTESQIESLQTLRNLFQLKSISKRITLQSLQSVEHNEHKKSVVIDDDISRVIPENCNDFQFSKIRQDYCWVSADKQEISVSNVSEMEDIFKKLPQIDTQLVPGGWIKNHIKWIVWKLASYELKFPKLFNRLSLTVKNVLEQLIYRYQRELYSMQRPALRKILENDDTPNKKMILCVSRILEVNGDNVSKNTTLKSPYELEVTDGWYSVTASIDAMLSAAVKNGKITVGTKLMTQGAELMNCSNGVSPLEDISAVRLKLFGNSTRRAKWNSKLGFQPNPAPTAVRLATVSPSGGKVSKLTVFIARIYPTLYVEKLPDGGNVTRSERMESVHASRHEIQKQHKMEKLYEEIEKELDIDAIVNEYNGKDKSGGMDSSLAMLARNADSQGIHGDLTAGQLAMLRDFNERRKETIQQKIQEKIQDRLALEDQSTVHRQVTPLLKVKVIDLNNSHGKNEENNSINMTTGVISIWRPAEGLMEVLTEGKIVDITNIFPSALRLGECHLSANRQTTFATHRNRHNQPYPHTEAAVRKYTDIWSANKAGFEPIFNEFDTVGLVAFIEPFSKDTPGITRPNYQIVYLADLDLNFLAVNFWNGLAAYGYENYLEVGKCVACSNLQHRQQRNMKAIALAYTIDRTSYSQFSNAKHLKMYMEEMQLKIKQIDLKSYIKECQLEIMTKLSIKKTHEQKGTAVENAVRTKDDKFVLNSEDLYLTGLDFESTLCESKNKLETPIASPILTAKRNSNEAFTPSDRSVRTNAEKKLKFLSFYGNPPPLSPIVLNANSPKLSKGYVKPVRLNMSSPRSEKYLPRTQKDIKNSSNYVPDNVEVFDDELKSFSPPLSLE